MNQIRESSYYVGHLNRQLNTILSDISWYVDGMDELDMNNFAKNAVEQVGSSLVSAFAELSASVWNAPEDVELDDFEKFHYKTYNKFAQRWITYGTDSLVNEYSFEDSISRMISFCEYSYATFKQAELFGFRTSSPSLVISEIFMGARDFLKLHQNETMDDMLIASRPVFNPIAEIVSMVTGVPQGQLEELWGFDSY